MENLTGLSARHIIQDVEAKNRGMPALNRNPTVQIIGQSQFAQKPLSMGFVH
jgi:hypothetical protein